MSTRIYIVHHSIARTGTEPVTRQHLVEAGSQAEAIRHVVKGSITCAVATPAELIEVEKAGEV